MAYEAGGVLSPPSGSPCFTAPPAPCLRGFVVSEGTVMSKFAATARAKLSSVVTKVKEATRKIVDRLSKNRYTKPLVFVARLVINLATLVVLVPVTLVIVAVMVFVSVVAMIIYGSVTLAHKATTLAYVLVSALLSAILGRGTARYELHCGWIVLSQWNVASFQEASLHLMSVEEANALSAERQELAGGVDIEAKVESVEPPVVTVTTTPKRKAKKRPTHVKQVHPLISFGEAG